MSTPPERTKLTAVYLTSGERHLVRSALDVLVSEIRDGANGGASAAFARAHAIETIEEAAALFADRAAAPTEQPAQTKPAGNAS